jgi:hypothetical protein
MSNITLAVWCPGVPEPNSKYNPRYNAFAKFVHMKKIVRTNDFQGKKHSVSGCRSAVHFTNGAFKLQWPGSRDERSSYGRFPW